MSLKEKIRQRQLKAGIVSATSCVVPKKQEPSLPLGERISKIVETIKLADYDHFRIAEELNDILCEDKISRSELSKKLHKTQGWITKKLALLSAPQEDQDKIKKGELAATNYYKSSIGLAKKLTLTRKQADEIARLFRDISIKFGLNIELSKKPTKAEVMAAFSRVKDIRRAVLK